MHDIEPGLFEALKGEISLEEVFLAYFECRRNKRKTINALQFELNYEENLIQLWRDINSRAYKVGRSIAFVVNKPVIREIFAADFRDRVVHHLIIRKLLPLFEKAFSPHSYSCRHGKGTLFGVNEVYKYIQKCSENYTADCYVLKLDIQAFFININHNILYQMLERFILQNYQKEDQGLLLFLVRKVVFNAPQNNCIKKGKKAYWKILPKKKSLFRSKVGFGLPIGNLTSQIFANFYLNDFDSLVERYNQQIYYGRYVDDFVLIHKNPKVLEEVKPIIAEYLNEKNKLLLHPKKVYLQHYAHGLPFVGCYLMPGRIYAGTRLKTNFYQKIYGYKQIFLYNQKPDARQLLKTGAVLNSYFGFLKHINAFYLRKKCWEKLAPELREYFKCVRPYHKMYIKGEYTPKAIKLQEMRSELVRFLKKVERRAEEIKRPKKKYPKKRRLFLKSI